MPSSHLAVCKYVCSYVMASCINSTELDKDLDVSGSNESERSVLASFGSDASSSTPISVSSHSLTPQDFQISPTLEQEGMLEEVTDCSDNKIAGSYLYQFNYALDIMRMCRKKPC